MSCVSTHGGKTKMLKQGAKQDDTKLTYMQQRFHETHALTLVSDDRRSQWQCVPRIVSSLPPSQNPVCYALPGWSQTNGMPPPYALSPIGFQHLGIEAATYCPQNALQSGDVTDDLQVGDANISLDI